jgi:hypothetical protein
MTTPTDPSPDYAPIAPPAPAKRRVWPLVAGASVLLLIVIAAMSNGDPKPEPSGPATSAGLNQSAAATPAPAPDVMPAASDFRIQVRTLRKQCFGSAGCNVIYQIDPDYTGQRPLSESRTYRVVYEVIGGEDGPAVNNFTVTGSQARFPQQEMISTQSAGTTLTAHATSVSDR